MLSMKNCCCRSAIRNRVVVAAVRFVLTTYWVYDGYAKAAMMEMIGLTECIADTVDGYVTLAARMGRDAAWRCEVAEKVAARRHRAFDDPACIEGLEAFLLQAVEKGAR